MPMPTIASVMRTRAVQVVQSRGARAGTEAKRLAPWAIPAGAVGTMFEYHMSSLRNAQRTSRPDILSLLAIPMSTR